MRLIRKQANKRFYTEMHINTYQNFVKHFRDNTLKLESDGLKNCFFFKVSSQTAFFKKLSGIKILSSYISDNLKLTDAVIKIVLFF